MRILLVEDEPSAARFIAKGLREATYAVDVAADGNAAAEQCQQYDYDAIVLDVMLPGRDGLSVCREIRAAGSDVPVLMLTARDAVEARVQGLDAGADDYLTKPFSLRCCLRDYARSPGGKMWSRVLRYGSATWSSIRQLGK